MQHFFSWLVDNLATEVQRQSVGVGGLIDGGDMMLFLGMIDGCNTMLLLAGAGGLIKGRDTTLCLSAGRRFG
jgi:hypothetical protein